MSSRKEVVIIGAGVIGCSIAYHLAKRGVPSQVIEKDSIAARASGKAVALWGYTPRLLLMERPPQAESQSVDQFFSALEGSIRPWIELAWIGWHRLPEVALEIKEREGLDVEYAEVPRILVALSESDEKTYKANLSFLRSEGYYETCWLEADNVRAIYPDITPRVRGGLLVPALVVEPYRYTLGLAQVAEKMGATFRQGEVVGFRHQGSRVSSVLLATGTEVEADVVVIAMGPWTGQGTSWLGKEIPILINREQCLVLEVPQKLPPYMIWTSREYVTPKPSGKVIVGHLAVPDVQSNFDSSLTTEEFKSAVLDAVVGILPTLEEGKLVEHRGDFEGYAPAPNYIQPVVGRLPEWDNAYVAARMGTTGMFMSLGTGQLMAELIIAEGQIPGRVRTMMEALSPARL